MFNLTNKLNNKYGYNLDEEFVERTEKAYEEITGILKKHKLILDWDEGEGILLSDTKFSKYVQVSSSFTNFDVWE